jgi:phosphoribosylcarboxyaminoimidazole (NCAIR) mutase
VAVVMGSDSDLPTMEPAVALLQRFGVGVEVRVLSAHRTPLEMVAFAQAAGLTGVVLTKLDGSARGGVALAVASEAGLPIRFIGAGEGIRDLRPFNSFEFIEALLDG